MSKTFVVVFTYAASPVTEPKIAAFVLQDTKNFIITQAFLRGKMGKTFAIIFAYPCVKSAEPKVTAFVFRHTRNPITAHTFLRGKMGKTFAIVFTHPPIGTDPKVATFIFQQATDCSTS